MLKYSNMLSERKNFMKSKLTKLTVLVLSVICIACFALACAPNESPSGGQNPPQHIHEYSTEYTYDAEFHWFECECGDDKGNAPHVFVDGKCVCGQTKGEQEPAYTEGLVFVLNKNEDAYIVESYNGIAVDIIIPAIYNGKPVVAIGKEAFVIEYSRGVTIETLKISGQNLEIGYRAFAWCENLTSVELLDGVTSIGDYAFTDCASLTSVVIPDSVESISERAFYHCDSLTSVEYKGSIDSWAEIGFGSSTSNSIYFEKKLIIDGKEVTEVKLTTATKINDYAFSSCSSLTSVVIGDCVKGINSSAFEDCSSLTSVVIPNSVEIIGKYAFYNCYSLSVYYKGTAEDWAKITIGSNNSGLTNGARYCYSENTPTTRGNYWRYVNGVPTIWG